MSFSSFLSDIKQLLPPDRVIEDEFRRFVLGTDASFYRLTPKLVLSLATEFEVVRVLKLATKHGVPVTFRAAGTSLSGQAVSDSVLLTLTDAWKGLKIDPLGELVHVQPGVIGQDVNKALKPYGRKIGPDPASINACKVGGIVANNASGMCCGTAHNSYHTLQGARLVLADGTVLDTRNDESVQSFRESHASLLADLMACREDLLANNELSEKVRHKYRLKNTTGYGLNALLDYSDSIDMLTHLFVGSEGTLGFISEVSMQTVDDFAHRASAFVAFESLNECALAVAQLKTQPVDAVELLDARAIESVKDMPGMPEFAHLFPKTGGVLLIDVRGGSQALLLENITQVESVLACAKVWNTTGFTTDTALIEKYWKIRKGTFPAVGAVREAGTTVIIEDVAFPIEKLAEGVGRLQQLFDKYHYDEAIIFGHALEGNVHFVFTQRFDNEKEVSRYQALMDELGQVVAVELNGSLKAEHGTGRNMAPFVALEWGDDAFGLMKRLKTIFDPLGVLNPGVIINDSPTAHIEHLKPMPIADDLVDRCIECGFCEPVCPSKNFTLTPRQRITAYREISRRQSLGEEVPKSWKKAFQFQGVDTCAATGLCESSCPVGINTGDLVLKLRSQRNRRYRGLSRTMGRHFASVASVARGSLGLAHQMQKLGKPERVERLSRKIRQLSRQRTPLWLSTTPNRARPVYASHHTSQPKAKDTVVYWASCASQSMAGSAVDDRDSIPNAVHRLLKKAQLNVVYPQPSRGLCCGQPFKSKGQLEQADAQATDLVEALWEASNQGEYPILADTSPCALQVKQAAQAKGMRVLDSVAFIDEVLLKRLSITPDDRSVAVHVTCSAQKQGLEPSFERVLNQLTPNWKRPEGIHCCGFAGDKGFTLPELNESALASLPAQTDGCEYGISSSRTCEIGLSSASGLTYYSMLEVLDRQSDEL